MKQIFKTKIQIDAEKYKGLKLRVFDLFLKNVTEVQGLLAPRYILDGGPPDCAGNLVFFLFIVYRSQDEDPFFRNLIRQEIKILLFMNTLLRRIKMRF